MDGWIYFNRTFSKWPKPLRILVAVWHLILQSVLCPAPPPPPPPLDVHVFFPRKVLGRRSSLKSLGRVGRGCNRVSGIAWSVPPR